MIGFFTDLVSLYVIQVLVNVIDEHILEEVLGVTDLRAVVGVFPFPHRYDCGGDINNGRHIHYNGPFPNRDQQCQRAYSHRATGAGSHVLRISRILKYCDTVVIFRNTDAILARRCI